MNEDNNESEQTKATIDGFFCVNGKNGRRDIVKADDESTASKMFVEINQVDVLSVEPLTFHPVSHDVVSMVDGECVRSSWFPGDK